LGIEHVNVDAHAHLVASLLASSALWLDASAASSACTWPWPDCTPKKAARVAWATLRRAVSRSASAFSSSARVSFTRFCTAKPANSGRLSATPTLALLVRLFTPGW
jgi:hypothetical protein